MQLTNRTRGVQPYQPVSYKVLNIAPMTRLIKQAQQRHEVNAPNALHFCRGNFATYGEDNTLFGKYTGTFWRPMTIRGQKEQGIRTKDYTVSAPSSLKK